MIQVLIHSINGNSISGEVVTQNQKVGTMNSDKAKIIIRDIPNGVIDVMENEHGYKFRVVLPCKGSTPFTMQIYSLDCLLKMFDALNA